MVFFLFFLPTLSSRETTLVQISSITLFSKMPVSWEQFVMFKDSFPIGRVSVLLYLCNGMHNVLKKKEENLFTLSILRIKERTRRQGSHR